MIDPSLNPSPEEAAKDPERWFADGKYVLLQEAGRGGTAVVWKAWQTDLGRTVALKILAGSLWTDEDIKRFYREARMAAGLSHPNIASIFEIGAFEGRHFTAMEFVEGNTLSRLLAPVGKTRPMSLRRAVEVLREAALAVDYAHSKGIIHRDLKPHNIMIQKSDGRVFVMDFGLAKPVRPHDTLTASDAIMGTPPYMSPEQARGDTLDRRTDVYSLGTVLYEILTGKTPFDGRSAAETLMAVLSDDPVPPRQIRPRIHRDLETICLKTLEKDRARRYDTARAFADDLACYLEGESISARPASTVERALKLARRHPVISILLGGVVAAGILAAVLLGGVAIQTRSRVEALLSQAYDALDRDQIKEAVTFCDQALGLRRDDADAIRLKELCERKQARREESRRREAEETVKEIESCRAAADALFAAELFHTALAQYAHILALDPADAAARERRNQCLESIERRMRVPETLRLQATAWGAALGTLKEQSRRQEEKQARALPLYERARAIFDAAPRQTPGPELLASYSDAREALRKAILEDDGYVEAWYFRGQIRHRMGDYENADRDFQEALTLDPAFTPAASGSAMALLAQAMMHAYTPIGRNDKARAEAMERMGAAAERARKSADPVERACAIALERIFNRRMSAARNVLLALDETEKRGYFYYLTLGVAALEDGHPQEARQDLTAALELEPAAGEALFLRAAAAAMEKDWETALADADAAVDMAPPENYAVWLLRATIREASGNREGTVIDLERAVGIAGAPKDEIERKLVGLRETE